MGEWRECKLGDLIQSISETYKFTDKKVIFLNTSDIYLGNIINKNEFNPSALPGQAKKKIQTNDLLFSEIRPANGRYALVKDKVDNYVVSTKLMVLRSMGDILPEYLNIFLTSKDMLDYLQMLAEDRSGTFPQITFNHISSIDISLPPLTEQKAIAEVLSCLDDKIDLLHRQNKTLEEMAQTLFRQWFIEEAKDEWEEVTIGDFVKTNVSTIRKDSSLKTIQYLDTSSLTEGKIDSFQQLDLKEAPSRAKRMVKHNDILISTVRPNQKHYGIIKNPTEDIIVSTGYCVVSCEKINPHFIYILLTTDDMTEYLHSIAEGSTSTYPSLKPSDIEAVEFLLPPEEKLQKFSDYADNAWEKIDKNHIQIKTLENMRDTLLPKLMSGEVRVKI